MCNKDLKHHQCVVLDFLHIYAFCLHGMWHQIRLIDSLYRTFPKQPARLKKMARTQVELMSSLALFCFILHSLVYLTL